MRWCKTRFIGSEGVQILFLKIIKNTFSLAVNEASCGYVAVAVMGARAQLKAQGALSQRGRETLTQECAGMDWCRIAGNVQGWIGLHGNVQGWTGLHGNVQGWLHGNVQGWLHGGRGSTVRGSHLTSSSCCRECRARELLLPRVSWGIFSCPL